MSTRSSKVSSPAVVELVKELISRWPNHKKDAAQLRFYVEDIGAMVEEFGLRRMRAAVTAARGRCNFLPEPGELFKLLPAPEIHSGQPFHDPDCPDCSGSGWRMVAVIDAGSGRAERRATRCDCKPSSHTETRKPTLEQVNAWIEEAMQGTTMPDLRPDKRRMDLRRQAAEKAARSATVPQVTPDAGVIPTSEQLAEELTARRRELAAQIEGIKTQRSPKREAVQ
jgi:hypothetical protein